MNNLDNGYGKVLENERDNVSKGCSDFLRILAFIIWLGGFCIGLSFNYSFSIMLITWFSAAVFGGLVMGVSDIIWLLGKIEYNTRNRNNLQQDSGIFNQPTMNGYYQQPEGQYYQQIPKEYPQNPIDQLQ